MSWDTELEKKSHLVEEIKRGLLGLRMGFGQSGTGAAGGRGVREVLMQRLDLISGLDLLDVRKVSGIEELRAADDGDELGLGSGRSS